MNMTKRKTTKASPPVVGTAPAAGELWSYHDEKNGGDRFGLIMTLHTDQSTTLLCLGSQVVDTVHVKPGGMGKKEGSAAGLLAKLQEWGASRGFSSQKGEAGLARLALVVAKAKATEAVDAKAELEGKLTAPKRDIATLAAKGMAHEPTSAAEFVERGKTVQKAIKAAAAPKVAPGTVLLRDFKGKPITVNVTEAGFEYDGLVFTSISACAKHITGYTISGPVFFGLAKDKT